VARRLTQRGKDRRDQLMAYAAERFAEQGYHPTSVSEIVSGLGVGKGVFYWYFESKEALFAELLQKSLLHLRRAQHMAIEGIADPRLRIERGIEASIEFFRVNPGFLGLIRTAARYEEFAAFVHRGQEIIAADTAHHIKEGMAAGSIRHGDPELMAHGILGAIFHFVEVYFGTDSESSLDRPELAHEATAFCMRGILEPTEF
jgi:AcrR family transcriptional regulator